MLEYDPDRGVEVCCSIMENIEEDVMWHKWIVFSDEATFYRAGSMDRLVLCVLIMPINNLHVLHKHKLKWKGI